MCTAFRRTITPGPAQHHGKYEKITHVGEDTDRDLGVHIGVVTFEIKTSSLYAMPRSKRSREVKLYPWLPSSNLMGRFLGFQQIPETS